MYTDVAFLAIRVPTSPFIMSDRHCNALVIHCIDFRFHEAIRQFVANELGVASYDLLTVPGAAKHLTASGSPERRIGLLEDIGISIRLHVPSSIIIVNHADCGAYGGRAAFATPEAEATTHRSALTEATMSLRASYPSVAVRAYYARLDDGTIGFSSVVS